MVVVLLLCYCRLMCLSPQVHIAYYFGTSALSKYIYMLLLGSLVINLGDHQTLITYGHVGFHGISSSIFFLACSPMLTFMVGDLV